MTASAPGPTRALADRPVPGDRPDAGAPSGARRAVRGGILGNYVDQFDIFLPVIALAPAASRLYGGGNLATNAGLVFVATLIGRPLGAAILGPVADRIGRTTTTQISMAGVGVATALVALVPGHSVLGAGTLAAILALRLVSGLFIGGGYTSAVPLAMEWTAPRRRGLVSGLIMWMSPWANASIAALVLVLLRVLGVDRYATWGWRIPFALGAAMAFGMLAYYRRHVSDVTVPAASEPDEDAGAAASVTASATAGAPATPAEGRAGGVAGALGPLANVLVGANRGALWRVFVLMTGLWIYTNMAIAVLTGQLKATGHLSDQDVTFTMMCATAVSAVAMAVCGHASTRIGRRAFYVGFGAVSAVVAPVVYLAVFRQSRPTPLVLLVVALQIVTVSAYGPVAAYLTERFPPAVRSSGYGLAYSLSIVLPALYPYYLPVLAQTLGEQGAVAALLALAGVLVAVGAASGATGDRLPGERT